jgi:hypothetical protein
MPYLQEVIHKLEAGSWIRHLKIGLAALALVGLVVGYNWRSFRNFGTQEAMDSAQLARNLSQGKGYTTSFVRPLSLYLVKQRNGTSAAGGNDPARIKENHPDLANPPVYPGLLAVLMKVVPMKWTIDSTKAFWSRDGRFWRYQPDFVISVFNEMIFLAVIGLTFFLARRLFDPSVAWLSGLLLLGSELLWRFSVSGLSTMLLMLLFLALAWCLVLVEQEAREPKGGPGKLFGFAGAAGVLVGLGMLTRYSFGWLILPVGIYLILFGGPRKAALCLLTLAMFLLVVAPWVYRNVRVSGLPFGTATFAVLEGTALLPEHQLARSLTPDLKQYFFGSLLAKLFGNTRALLQNELPKLGGSWLTPLFLTGLLLGFRNQGIRRLRYFLMMSLATLIVVQALGRTQLTEDSPELNSENLIVLLVPLVFVYGVSLFFLMLDQMNLAFRGLRFIIVGVFAFVMTVPMIFSFLPPRPSPIVFPPYHPHAIQQISGWMKDNELMMSDVPWAVAWYGQRQCIWLTLDAADNFFAVNDLLKPVRALYLTQQTMDGRFATQWIKPGGQGWGNFLLESILQRRAFPATFPLREAAPGFLPDQFFLTDQKKRWEGETPVTAAPAKPAVTEKPRSAEKPAK